MYAKLTNPTKIIALASVASFALAACGTDSSSGGASSAAPVATEQESATPRLALSYDGGVLILDANSLDQVADIPVEGFTRLNSAGNGRNVFVSTSDGFQVLDMGTWTESHGDHGHSYTATPVMTDMRFGGTKPGHVVPHDGRITLFSDGTGEVDIVDPDALAEGRAESTSHTVPEPHHGVAVARADDTLVVSVGNEDERSGIAILDGDRREIARNDQCPGIHGESGAADGVLTFGCEDGILIVRGNEIQKVQSPDGYGRIGNQAGDESSPISFGDYKKEQDAELERPQQFSLTDTRNGTIRIVPISTSYSFRSLERGPNGEAVLLGTDGAIHVFDVHTGAEIRSVPAIGAWTEPDEWQSPMPNMVVQNGVAYVSDPSAKTITAFDLADGKRKDQAQLPQTTIELTGVTG